MADPKRVQLRRTAGWRLPPNTVHVARPGRWGNPYRVVNDCQAGGLGPAVAVAMFEKDLRAGRLVNGRGQVLTVEMVRAELAGRDLACWCKLDQPCHADVLVDVANEVPAALDGSIDGAPDAGDEIRAHITNALSMGAPPMSAGERHILNRWFTARPADELDEVKALDVERERTEVELDERLAAAETVLAREYRPGVPW